MIRACAARRSLATAGSPGLRPTIRGGSSSGENSTPTALTTRIERKRNSGPGSTLIATGATARLRWLSAALANAETSLEAMVRLAAPSEIVTVTL